MPIPDVIFVDKSETEKESERREAEVYDVCNELARQQLVCGKVCFSCLSKCKQLQDYIDLGGPEDV
jgi:hypothetical protein